MIAAMQSNKSMKRATGREFTEFKIKRKPTKAITQLSLQTVHHLIPCYVQNMPLKLF